MQTTTNRLAGVTVPTIESRAPTYRRDYTVLGTSYRQELRVGRYGLEYSTTGYGLRRSQGTGGKLLHLVSVRIITELPADFDAAESCRANSSKYELNNPARYQHGGAQHHTCNALKVGDIVGIDPICVDQNARGVSADTRQAGEAGALDTDSVTCRNCLVRKLGVDPASLPDVEAIKAEARGSRAAAAAARPRCPNCGQERPKTKATERGERPVCGDCKTHLDSAKYFGEGGHADLVAREMSAFYHRRAVGLSRPERASYITAEAVA